MIKSIATGLQITKEEHFVGDDPVWNRVGQNLHSTTRLTKHQSRPTCIGSESIGLGIMGTILDALTAKLLSKLGQIIQDELVMTLSVKKDIKRLKKKIGRAHV